MHPVIEKMRADQIMLNTPRIEANWNNYGVYIQKDFKYMNDEDPYHTLDVILPNEKVEKRKVIITIHGGGYLSCYKEINQHQATYFASQGYAVVNINYTLYSEGDFRDNVKEFQAVLKWICDNHVQFGFDLDHIYAIGDSAGGHLVLVLAASQNVRVSQEYFGYEYMGCSVKAYCAVCPLATFQTEIDAKEDFYKLVQSPLYPLLQDKEFVKQTDYHTYYGENYPPMMIITTPTDSLVYKYTKELHDFLVENHIDHTYGCYEKIENDISHVFNVLHPDYIESIQANRDVIDFFEKY